MAGAKANSSLDLSGIKITKLDEYCGVPLHESCSCEEYLRRNVLEPWGVDGSRYIGFDGNDPNLNEICLDLEERVLSWAPFDLTVLGVGPNGHIGMNEPDERLRLDVHIAPLEPETSTHPSLVAAGYRPTRGLTMGIGAIMSSACVILLVHGDAKRNAMEQLAIPVISTRLPASILHLHPNAHCLVSWP